MYVCMFVCGLMTNVNDLLNLVFYNFSYLMHPPWDTEIPAPELNQFIQQHPHGIALDLGCGTGTNMQALLEAGWKVDGVEFAIIAVRKARKKLAKFSKSGTVYLANILDLDFITKQYDLILDIGCYHSLLSDSRKMYRNNLIRLLNDEGTYLMYAFIKVDEPSIGIDENDMDEFAELLAQKSRKYGIERGTRASVWLEYQK